MSYSQIGRKWRRHLEQKYHQISSSFSKTRNPQSKFQISYCQNLSIIMIITSLVLVKCAIGLKIKLKNLVLKFYPELQVIVFCLIRVMSELLVFELEIWELEKMELLKIVSNLELILWLNKLFFQKGVEDL